jgi:hypothetical protein
MLYKLMKPKYIVIQDIGDPKHRTDRGHSKHRTHPRKQVVVCTYGFDVIFLQ